MVTLFKELQPKVGGFDTEANGLHIINAKMFLFQFGFIHPDMKQGYTFAVDLEKQPELGKAVITTWHSLAKTLDIYLAHNTKFDLHMLANIGLPYAEDNLSDTMFYIRYAHDALTVDNGGPPLGLKDYAARYIDRAATSHEKLLSSEKTSIVKTLNAKLKLRLSKLGTPPPEFGAKSYTMKVMQDLFKDPIMDVEDLPSGVKEAYLDWLHFDVPLYLQHKISRLVEPDMIGYQTLNRENLVTYAHYDIVYLLEVYIQTAPVVKARGNEAGIQFENSVLLPLWEMERVGFKTNVDYIKECRIKMKDYIIARRKRLFECAGQEFSIGQHALVKKLLTERFGLDVESTNSGVLDLKSSVLRATGENPEALEFIDLLQELRTLEKWYSVYILRFLRDLRFNDRLYTTINQVGTVSGRVTSDFQQFPKKGIKTVDGEELFQPRKMVQPTGGDYDAIVYLDYSQIELRFQALYTILVGHPDLNLCRAYMPYECVSPDGTVFDYNNPAHIVDWHGEWYYKENTKEHWEPTDVHGATTEKATGLTKDHPDFKTLRSTIGKRTNFAKNYGAKYNKIKEMFPDKTDEEVKRIDDAYYAAFPGVKAYHTYCYDRAGYYSYTSNLFNVRYYGVSGHKLINMLVQGSSAFYLKWKIRQLYDYCKEHGIKTRFQMNIHDELSFEHFKDDDLNVFFEFKKIMEDWQDGLVPVVADMEVTTTTWAAKEECETIEELQNKVYPVL